MREFDIIEACTPLTLVLETTKVTTISGRRVRVHSTSYTISSNLHHGWIRQRWKQYGLSDGACNMILSYGQMYVAP